MVGGSLQHPTKQSVADLGTAFTNFFNSCKGKRKGKKLGYPKFKKKTGKQAARFRKGGFSIKDNKVFLAKIGCIKTIWSRPLPSDSSSVTVIKDKAGRYFRRFCCRNSARNQACSQPISRNRLRYSYFCCFELGAKSQ